MVNPENTALAAGLAGFVDPASGASLERLSAVEYAGVEGGRARVRLRFGFPVGGYAHELQPLHLFRSIAMPQAKACSA